MSTDSGSWAPAEPTLAAEKIAEYPLTGIMIKFLAKFFRGVHLIFGVSAPPEGENERSFVLTWLGILAFLAALLALLIYLIPHLYFKH